MVCACVCVCVCVCTHPVDGIPELLDLLSNGVCDLLQPLSLLPSLLLLPSAGLLMVPQHRTDHLQQSRHEGTSKAGSRML